MEALQRLVFLIKTIAFGKHTRQQSRRTQSTHNDPNRLQRICIRLNELRLLDPGFHALDDTDERRGVLAICTGHGREEGVGEELLLDLVLENNPTYCHPKGLAEDTDEGVEGN